MTRRAGAFLGTLLLGFGLLGMPGHGSAQRAPTQQAPALQIEREDGSTEALGLATDRGYATLPLATFRALGWTVRESGPEVELSVPSRASLTFRVGSAFFRWDGRPLQLADVPYRDGAETYLPAQVVTDFFPEHLPELYDYDTDSGRLRAGDPRAVNTTADGGAPAGRGAERPSPTPQVRAPAESSGGVVTVPPVARPVEPVVRPVADDAPRLVWIDAGHGGADPGAIGHGVREKEIALAVSRRLAELLRTDPRVEVRMTREDDGFVDLWERGLLATDAKGERTGVFVSIHANSFPARRTTRGFETYFLSEARTEDERRVSAIENAPLTIRGRGVDASRQSDLDFILRELRNFDHAHWSALLAEMVQDELAKFHPGPNRGVKQAPLAVLTNAIMPSVLVEVGFVTNEEEARLMRTADFQDRAARGLANAILSFLERYPPGNGFGASR